MTLAEELGVEDADEDDLYGAMGWLLARKQRIEKKLARRHPADGALVLCDFTSSYYEGYTCPWARHSHHRDGQKGLPIIVYGVLTDNEGRPIAVEVYAGNTGDPTTVADKVLSRYRVGKHSMLKIGEGTFAWRRRTMKPRISGA